MNKLLKVLLAAGAYVAGTVLSGIVTARLHIPGVQPPPAPTASPGHALLLASAAAPLLTIPLVLLEAGLGGTRWQRSGAIFALLFVSLGVNTVIELSVFSSLVPAGVVPASLHLVLPCAFAALVLGAGPRRDLPPGERGRRAGVLRYALAWLAFPLIYFVFGLCVAPFVVPHYASGVAGFTIPPLGTIAATQLLRSALFLAASVPLVRLWRGGRSRFVLATGLSYAAAVGVFYMAQAEFLPPTLRLAHACEIVADSFAYAAVLAWAFIPRSEG